MRIKANTRRYTNAVLTLKSKMIAFKIYMVSGSIDMTIQVWRVNLNGIVLKSTFTGHKGIIRALVFLKNDYLISSSDDRTLRIWNIISDQFLRVVGGMSAKVLSLDIPIGKFRLEF